ncbi:MAG: Crp/Fnr family transcriptional regulator [Myxococcaceae bacterium]
MALPKMPPPDLTPVTKLELKRVKLVEFVDNSPMLKSSPLLLALSAEERRELLSHAMTRRFSPRANVFEVGDSGASMFLVLRGEARLSVCVEEEAVQVGASSVGEFFGEEVILEPGSARDVAAQAVGELDLAEFSRAQLESAARRSPALMEELRRARARRHAARSEMVDFVGRW